ncbi:MAG: succinate dehydrogenase cytochrome b subunit [Bacteroidia bacterium]|nr:MAG: succinate dehydrogenase cytochrome b subunit [Bacteroidia bacterium]
MSSIFTSSLGKKLLMSLAGIFLIIFLLVHMGINLLIVIFDDPMVYNKAAHIMSTNILIKIFEIILFGGFLLHMIYALILQIQNWVARPNRYNKANYSNTSFFSKFMIHTALITLVFLVIHMMDFYLKAKFGHAAEVIVDGKAYHDFASEIIDKFKMLPFVIFYIAAFVFLGFHLVHGFQSAFKTLGMDHKKYTPVVQFLAIIYSTIIVGGFSFIPVYIYFL